MAICKHMKLRASLEATIAVWGKYSKRTKEITAIMDLTDNFMSIRSKEPEDQMLFHTTLVVMKNMTQIRINSWPDPKNFDKVIK